MKFHYLVRAILFGFLAFNLRFIFDSDFDYKDLMVIFMFVLILINEFIIKLRKKKSDQQQ